MDSRSTSWRGRLGLKVAVLILLGLLVVSGVYILAPTDRAWPETKRALEARGEVLDWEKLVPRFVAAEENLFEDPVAASLLPLKGPGDPAEPPGCESTQIAARLRTTWNSLCAFESCRASAQK